MLLTGCMRMLLDSGDALAVAVVQAIRTGDAATLGRLLDEHPELAAARLGGEASSRTLLHIATDWPGHFPGVAATVAALVAGGADVNAAFAGEHAETPLHWAASSDDIEALAALLDADADIEAPGAVIGGGTAMADACAFGQWRAAQLLVVRGARTTLFEAAALGLSDRLEAAFASDAPPSPGDVNLAFWGACHGGRRITAEYLHARGADINWLPPWEPLAPLDAALRAGNDDLVAWLRSLGAVPAGA